MSLFQDIMNINTAFLLVLQCNFNSLKCFIGNLNTAMEHSDSAINPHHFRIVIGEAYYSWSRVKSILPINGALNEPRYNVP